MFDPKRFVLALGIVFGLACCAASPLPPSTTPEAAPELPGKLSSEALVVSWQREHAEQDARLAEAARGRAEAEAETERRLQLEAEQQRSAQLELEAQRERELAERTRRAESDQKSRQERAADDDAENDDSRPARSCCKICRSGCACGDTCISCSKTCHRGAGCACDG